jgi:RimJ/RimL family protein N-acetyltransferase
MNKKILTSKNLQLRLVEKSDLNVIHKLLVLPETDKYNTLGIPKNIEVTKLILQTWIKETQSKRITNYTFAIVQRSSKNFVGLFGLKLGNKEYKNGEVWYKIHPDFWNKGIATESLNRILDFVFNELKLHRIEAGCAVENIASIKVMEKAGMIKEGRCRKVLPLESGWSDTFEYAILNSDKRLN